MGGNLTNLEKQQAIKTEFVFKTGQVSQPHFGQVWG
jgi:hypothetical protein